MPPDLSNQLRERIMDAAEHAVRVAAEDLLGRAQRDAPVEEGTLRASGNAEVHRTHDGIEAVVSFSTPYAARQHEEVTWHHPRGGRAKYLEANLKAMAPRYRELVANAVRRAF